jgi:hypothetical protein
MTDTNYEQAARAAEFIFRGTVERVQATTMDEVEASERTAVVHVDQVLHAPAAFAGLEGQSITVRLSEPGSVQEQEQAVFFANGWLFGDSLAVREIHHQPVEHAPEALASRIAEARSTKAELEMQDRVARADVIVSGRISDVRPPAASVAAARPPQAGPVSEHDPNWMEAVVTVENTIKGQLPSESKETVILFPSSFDVAWADAPKFHAGQEGVFLLHRQERAPELAPTVAAEGYVALNPLDVRPKDQAERMQRLASHTNG